MSNPLKGLELSSEELKEIAALLAKKKRHIKGYKSMSENELLSSLTLSKPVKKGKKPKKISEKNLMNQGTNFLN